MPHTISWWSRLRIERLVWVLDQRLYDLPRHSRITTRREVRVNLLDAAHDVGTTEALRRVGGSGPLAQQYLVAELGEGPRPSWVATAAVGGLLPMLLNYLFSESGRAFQAGVLAGDPHATGTFAWHGIRYLQSATEITFTDGRADQLGGAWTPMTYLLWVLATVLAGRLWRLLPSRRRRETADD